MGAIFRINIVVLECPIMDMVPILKASNYSIVTTSLKAKKSCYDLDFNKKLAIVMGNEANGVKKEVINTSDEQILIPMPGKAESLNVAVATGIMAFEKVRKSIS
jgi:TrmH family RNA methyltransferase